MSVYVKLAILLKMKFMYFCTVPCMYDDIRDTLFADICNTKRDFCDLTVDSQFILIMSDPLCFKFVSKAMYCISKRRRCAMLR